MAGILPPDPTAEKAYQWRKELSGRMDGVRHVYRYNAESWEVKGREGLQKQIKILSIIAQIIPFVLSAVSIGFPLAMFYLPAWVPFGILLPTALGLVIAKIVIESVMTDKKRSGEYQPILGSFVKQHTLQSMRLIDESSLPPSDPRLRSDRKNAEEALLNHPPSGAWISRLAEQSGYNGFEMNPFLQLRAAMEYAGITDHKDRWEKIRELRMKVKIAASTPEGELEPFSQAYAELQKAAYGEPMPSMEALPALDFPHQRTKKDSQEYLQRFFSSLKRAYNALEALHEKGKALYKQDFEGWNDFSKSYEDVKKLISELKEEGLENLSLTPDAAVHQRLFKLSDQIFQLKPALEGWIDAHPTTRKEEFEKFLAKSAPTIPTQAQCEALEAWIKLNPDAATTKNVIQLIKDPNFPQTFGDWLSDDSKFWYKTAQRLLERGKAVRTAFEETSAAYKALPDTVEALEAFEGEKKSPLVALIDSRGKYNVELTGAARFGKNLLKLFGALKYVFVSGHPDQPFKIERAPQYGPQDSRGQALEHRRIEEIGLNRLLQSADKELYTVKKIRLIVLAAQILFLVVEVVLSSYFSVEWFFWSLAVFNALQQTINFFLDRKIKELQQKKQALKLEHMLRDRPDVDRIPGSRGRLVELKDVQGRYGLDGVRATWAKALVEDTHRSYEPPRKTEDDDPLKALAEEGSKIATKYLEDKLIFYRSRDYEPSLQKRIDAMASAVEPDRLRDRIEEIKKEQKNATVEELAKLKERKKALKEALNPFGAGEKRPLTKQPIRKDLTRLEKAMDKVGEGIQHFERKVAEYRGIRRRFHNIHLTLCATKEERAVVEQYQMLARKLNPKLSKEAEIKAGLPPLLEALQKVDIPEESKKMVADFIGQIQSSSDKEFVIEGLLRLGALLTPALAVDAVEQKTLEDAKPVSKDDFDKLAALRQLQFLQQYVSVHNETYENEMHVTEAIWYYSDLLAQSKEKLQELKTARAQALS